MTRLRSLLAGALALPVLLATPAAARERPLQTLPARDAGLIDQTIQALPAQRPGTIDLYALAFTGDGTEDVFSNEAGYFEQLAMQRLGARGALTLVNDLDRVEGKPAPLATYENLGQALTGIASRMDVNEDILLLYLTMHGTPEHELAVYFPPFVEDALLPEDLRTLLDDAGIRHRVIAISACYSGGFIRKLRNPDTMLLTAARADRPSFGCGSESTVTWFGCAWMVEGLNRKSSFTDAYAYALDRIAAWEKAEDFEASHPQKSEGRRIRERLQRWRAQTPIGEPLPYPHPIEEPGAHLPARTHARTQTCDTTGQGEASSSR